MKIYISGKISGLPIDEVETKFSHAANQIRTLGHKHVNPLDNGLKLESPWLLHMIVDLWMLIRCNGIYMLSDWRDSKGARIEYHVAQFFRKQIFIPLDINDEHFNEPYKF